MNLKERWVAALRSGDYQQGKGRLRNRDQYCCLGVLCDVGDPTGWSGYEYGGLVSYPPFSHMLQAGLPDIMVDILILMNDQENATFEEIANLIEAM